MGFIRVRQAKGPAHEFDIAEEAYARKPDAFDVIDKTPVAIPRSVKYQKGRRPLNAKRSSGSKPKGKSTRTSRQATNTAESANAAGPTAKTADETTAAESVGKE